ncbi:YihY/virulence factor BrkB family protein [Microbacterium aurantiacum]|uniref:YihY/virulence factor BrkB family protein n=1 Tax=Microbacterium aurantiacum TaxID=162393 RepID=UPI000C807E51|nr:YihY/virulence factor BrkB family protein [Microbacterium aurantiacum]
MGEGGGAEPTSARATRSPADLDSRSWKFVVRKVVHGFVSDGCPDIAATLTFYAVLALIPAVVVLVSLVGILGQGRETLRLVEDVTRAVAPEAAHGISDALEELASSSVAPVALAAGLAITVWAGARYVAAYGRGMNRIYGVEEGRPLWRLKLTQVWVFSVVMVAVAAATVLFAVSGPLAEAIGESLGLGESALTLWSVLRWPVLAVIVVFVVAFLSYSAPNVKHPRFRWMSIGAAAALLVLVAATLLFMLYVSNFAHYEVIYGSLTAVIVFLLWLWLANVSLMIGVEIDAEVERARELRAGAPAEARVQLPLRDADRIRQTARRDRDERAEARRLREGEDEGAQS